MIVSIDGSCKDNGKPHCISAGCAFFKFDDASSMVKHKIEEGSTNQRGEINGLLLALETALEMQRGDTTYLITDSEYIYNTIVHEWYENWAKRGWVTATGEPVKNRDLWEKAVGYLRQFDDEDLVVYHVKGHIFSFGKAAASNLIKRDNTLLQLYDGVRLKFATEKNNVKCQVELAKALMTFEKNHGYKPPMDKFSEMIVCNTVADISAADYLASYVFSCMV